MADKKLVQIRMDKDLWKAIAVAAIEQDMSVGKYVSKFLAENLEVETAGEYESQELLMEEEQEEEQPTPKRGRKKKASRGRRQ